MDSNTLNIISNTKRNNSNNEIEKAKKLLMSQPMMPMFSIKNIIAGSVGTVLPWIILLLIVSFIIII